MSKFADDTKHCHISRNSNDTRELQEDINKIVEWADKWEMNLSVNKCSVMHIRHNNTQKCVDTMHEALRGYCPCGGGQSIGYTVSDAIVGSWLYSTVNWSSPFCYFGRLLQVVDNRPHIPWQ